MDDEHVDLTSALPAELNVLILSFVFTQNGDEDWRAILRTVCKLWAQLIPKCPTSRLTIVRHWPKLSDRITIDGRMLYVATKEGRIDVLADAVRAGHLFSLTAQEPIRPETVHHHAPIRKWKSTTRNVPWHPLLLRAAVKGRDPYVTLSQGCETSIIMVEWLMQQGLSEQYRHFVVDEAIVHLRRSVLDRFLREDDVFHHDRVVILLRRICRRILRPKPLDPFSRFQLLPELLLDRFGIDLNERSANLSILLQKALLRLASELVEIRQEIYLPQHEWFEVFESWGWCLRHHVSMSHNLPRWLDPTSWTLQGCPSIYLDHKYGTGQDGIMLRIGLHLLLNEHPQISRSDCLTALTDICSRIDRIEFVFLLLWFGLRVLPADRSDLLTILIRTLTQYRYFPSGDPYPRVGWNDFLLSVIPIQPYWAYYGEWPHLISTTHALIPEERKIQTTHAKAIGAWMLERNRADPHPGLPNHESESNFHRREVITVIRHGSIETFTWFFDTYSNFRIKTVDALDAILPAPEAMIDAVFAKLDLPHRGRLNDAVFLKIRTVLEGPDADRPECQRFVRSACRHGFPWHDGAKYFERLMDSFNGDFPLPLPERCISIIERESAVTEPTIKKIKLDSSD